MKKISIIFLLFFFATLNLYGQDWTYVDSFDVYTGYVKREHPIYAASNQGELVLIVGIMGSKLKPLFPKNATFTYLVVAGETRIKSFINSMKTIRSKYEEWSKTAHDNDITSWFDKQIPVNLPKVCVMWSNYSDKKVTIVPHFIVSNSKYQVHLKGRAFSQLDYNFEFYLDFFSVKEIDSFINKIQPLKLNNVLDEKQRVENLFK